VISNKASRFSRESLSERTRSSWQGLKETAWNYNQKLTEIVDPLRTKAEEFASSIKQSYRESDNEYIKTVRRTILIDLGFSCEAETAIN
jgi:hypothetical protein